MKKKHYSPVLSVFMAVMACACGGNSASEPTDILQWDSVVVDTTANLTPSEDSPKAEIHLNIKYAKGKQAGSVNDTLMKSGILAPDYLSLSEKKMTMEKGVTLFVGKYLEDYLKDFGALYKRDPDHGASYNLQYSCETQAQEHVDGVVSYVASVYYYSGGAHGTNTTIAKNIDKKTGKILKLSDVFVPGYEEGLKELIVKKMAKQFDVKDINGLHEAGVFYGMEPYVTNNFVVGKDNVEFIYCDTEIAPHAVGEIRVSISRSELSQLLKKEEK